MPVSARPSAAPGGTKSHSSKLGQATSNRLPLGDQASSVKRPGTLARRRGAPLAVE